LIGTLSLNPVVWDGNNIYVDIDGFGVGTYLVTVNVYHISGHYLTSSANVTVVDTTAPEWVTSPEDQTIEVGTALNYQLQVTDLSDIVEWTVDDTDHFSIVDGHLTNSTVLATGDYGIIVTVTDAYGNELSAVINIYVIEPTLPPGGGDPTGLLLLAGGGAAAAVVIILLVVFTKKKKV
jgi:hypothetical protein